MDFNAAAWVFLCGFLLWIAAVPLWPKGLGSYECFKRSKRLDQITKFEFYKLFLFFTIAIHGLAVWQGFHLLNTGYQINLLENISPGNLGSMAGRSGGKGGIFLLVIQYLPIFAIGGYGIAAKQTYEFIPLVNNVLKGLRKAGDLKERELERAAKILNICSAKENKSPEIFLDKVCDVIIKERNISENSIAYARSMNVNEEVPQSTPNLRRMLQTPGETEAALSRLKSLRERGVITESEYKIMRKKELGI
jgi:hypothetical protein